MRSRRRAWASAALGVAILAGREATALPVSALVAGSARVEYEVRDGAGSFVPAYANAGFTQEVGPGGAVAVRVVAEARTWTRARFDAPDGASGPVGALALAGSRGARLRADAVAGVLQEIAARVRYIDREGLAERPEDVLLSGEARCVGMANLAVAALGAVGIEARVARGLLVDPAAGTSVPHRWIEVFYPDAGWVFSDPTESANFVSPYHILVTPPPDPDPAYEPRSAAALAPRVVSTSGALLPVDARPGARRPLAERKTGGVQFQAVVLGRVRPAMAGSVRLLGERLEYAAVVNQSGLFAFPGLEPGSYRLVGRFGDDTVEQSVRVLDAEVAAVEMKVGHQEKGRR